MSINNFDNFNRGEIRKIAEHLLDALAVAYLKNINDDNSEDIRQKISDIENSGINWDKDVVKSVRERYKQLMSEETLNTNLNKW